VQVPVKLPSNRLIP